MKELIEKSQGDVEILVGSGVDASVIETLYQNTKASSYHMSGKCVEQSRMKYRNPDVRMGLASMNEYEIWKTSEEKVREAKQCLILL